MIAHNPPTDPDERISRIQLNFACALGDQVRQALICGQEKKDLGSPHHFCAFNSPPRQLLSSWIGSTAECTAPGPPSFFGIVRGRAIVRRR